MTVIQNPRKAYLSNPQYCYTGMPVSATNLAVPMQQTFNHLRNWTAGQMVAEYIGRPDVAVNGDTATTTATFYIITGFPVKHDTTNPTRNLAIQITNWCKDWGAGGPFDETWKWYTTAAGALTHTLWDDWATGTGINDDTQYDDPSGTWWAWGGGSKKLAVTPVATGTNDGYTVSKLTCDYALVANLTVFAVPIENSLTLAQAVVPLSSIAAGQTIRGYDSDEGTSLGAIAHMIGSGDSVIHNSRRCMFQTTYPQGARATATMAWTAIRVDGAANATTYRVRPGNRTGGSSLINCEPAMILTADAGAQIRYRETTSGQTWTYTSGGDAAALITRTDGSTNNLRVTEDDYSEIVIETLTGAGKTIDLHTASLWEPYTGG